MKKMVLETDRLILRELTLNDVDDLLKVLGDREAMKFYPQPFDRPMTQAWIERNIDRYKQNGFGLWATILKESNKLIGDCGLVVQQVNGVEEVEIGYHIRRDLWGRGLATEAAQACRDWGFDRLGGDRLISLIHPGNIASRRVAEKVGMSLIEEIEWKHKSTCIYAVEREVR
ncbi:MAG: GNAT family N-acetyltransferase [Cyanosarcina radialis HA8281-LM2]|nr:GNAT family N-acetyltransferase [Cyanosarcina radialis HA8281-LM2]